MLFIPGIVLLILGMSAFTLGADMAVMPMGELIGAKLTESRSLWLMILISFLLGLALTLAEPDLQVLTRQVPAVPDFVLAATVAFGVGIFLVIAMLRILFQVKISHMFILTRVLTFVVAAEPAVHILNKQIEDITNGAISRRVMMLALSIGVGIALVLAMIRVLTSIDIWYFLLPGYAVALLLTFVVPAIFTAVAFDSGGVAAGGPLLLDAFGIVGMPLGTAK